MAKNHDPLKPVQLGKPAKAQESGFDLVPDTSTTRERAVIAPPWERSKKEKGREMRAVSRRPCSFPGVLRILVPEHSFVPLVLAVRIVDLSPVGARVESRPLSQETFLMVNKEPRWVRLEIMIPSRSRMTVPGRLVWAEEGDTISLMGISISPRRDDLAEACLPDWSPDENDSTFLSPPKIGPFPSSTRELTVRITGTAFDAETVLVRAPGDLHEVKVEDGHFAVDVKLEPNTSNEFNFFAKSGDLLSDPTPVWVVHQAKKKDTQPYRICGIFDDLVVERNGQSLRLTFDGRPEEFVRAVRRIEQILDSAESCQFSFELKGEAEKAADLLRKGSTFPWRVGQE